MDTKLIVMCILITILLVSIIAYFDESDGIMFTSATVSTANKGGIIMPNN